MIGFFLLMLISSTSAGCTDSELSPDSDYGGNVCETGTLMPNGHCIGYSTACYDIFEKKCKDYNCAGICSDDPCEGTSGDSCGGWVDFVDYYHFTADCSQATREGDECVLTYQIPDSFLVDADYTYYNYW